MSGVSVNLNLPVTAYPAAFHEAHGGLPTRAVTHAHAPVPGTGLGLPDTLLQSLQESGHDYAASWASSKKTPVEQ